MGLPRIKTKVLLRAEIKLTPEGEWLASEVIPPKKNLGFVAKGETPAAVFNRIGYSGGFDKQVIFEIRAIKRVRE